MYVLSGGSSKEGKLIPVETIWEQNSFWIVNEQDTNSCILAVILLWNQIKQPVWLVFWVCLVWVGLAFLSVNFLKFIANSAVKILL